ncbi:Uncharacterised protein [Mycobacteroides abscessus subsp. massiliense]|nr:Uncharacterised protein [Mycobacteroides abscessus subsp. massiliense]
MAYQRKLFTDCQQRLCLGKDCGITQEPVHVVCTIVFDHIQREIQYPILSTLS